MTVFNQTIQISPTGTPTPVLLMHCDGADTSTSFIDSSPSAHTITPSGSVQIKTDQSKFGGSAARTVTTAGARLALDGSSDFAFGTGDFTIDFWVRYNSITTTQAFFIDFRTANGLYPTIYQSTTKQVYYFTNSADRITGTTVLAAGTWYHIAVARSGTSTKLFLNGTQEGSTFTDSTNYIVGANRPSIGQFGNNDSSAVGVDGWMDEIRILKGTAAWTSNFTVPAAPYGTNQLLTLNKRPNKTISVGSSSTVVLTRGTPNTKTNTILSGQSVTLTKSVISTSHAQGAALMLGI